MIAASGGRTATASSASCAVSAGTTSKPGVAEDHPQRAEDLRLVVADQHPGARSCGVTLAGATDRQVGS